MVKNENRKIAAGAWQTYDKKCSNQTKKRRKHLIGSVWKRGVNWITFLLDCSCKACNWKIQWNPLRGYSFFYLSHSHLIQLFCVDSTIHSDAQTDFISLSLSLCCSDVSEPMGEFGFQFALGTHSDCVFECENCSSCENYTPHKNCFTHTKQVGCDLFGRGF